MSKVNIKTKPLAEIHLTVYEDDIHATPMVINGGGQDLATLLLISFAESNQFFEVVKSAVNTFTNHGNEIQNLYNNK